MTEADKKVKELQKKRNTCNAMAIVCKKSGNGLLEQFYTKAAKGFEKKIFKAQFVK